MKADKKKVAVIAAVIAIILLAICFVVLGGKNGNQHLKIDPESKPSPLGEKLPRSGGGGTKCQKGNRWLRT